MSASETASGAVNLHKSIEQLIAETIRQSQSSHEAEKLQLTNALSSALTEIESSQQALNRAAELLRSALGTDTTVVPAQHPDPTPEVTPEPEAVSPANVEELPGPTSTPANDRGPHELDVIAHNASITHASGLQTWLRGREEVSSAQTREFVNGELRLHLNLSSGLQMADFESWLGEHSGTIVTNTEKVIEIRFGEAA